MKLDFNLTNKPTESDSQNLVVDDTPNGPTDNGSLPTTDSINLPVEQEDEPSAGAKPTAGCVPASPGRTMDWPLLKRITLAQTSLAVTAMLCITVVSLSSKMNQMLMWYKTTMFMWVVFLVMTAYCGQKSGPKNYTNLVAYFVMSLFQTVVDAFWIAGIFMAVCYSVVMRDQDWQLGHNQSQWVRTGLIALEMVESFAILGTVLTGLLGVVVCCRGFGRLLQHQDAMIMEQSSQPGERC